MREELDCLLRENIRLHVSDSSDTVSHVKAFRGELEDLIRHLVLDARDAMPTGGELNILTGTLALDDLTQREHSHLAVGGPAAPRKNEAPANFRKQKAKKCRTRPKA